MRLLLAKREYACFQPIWDSKRQAALDKLAKKNRFSHASPAPDSLLNDSLKYPICLMPGARVELARPLGAVDFESTASAYSAIPAH